MQSNDENAGESLPVEEDRESYMFLEGPRGRTVLGPDALLVALDETGHEELADARYPIFGMGGCVVPVRAYWNLVHRPWLTMKQRHFGGAASALHAVKVARRSTPEQKAAIASFFQRNHFPRCAALLSDRTALKVPIARYDATWMVLLKRLERIASRVSFTRVAIVLESTERGLPLAEAFCRTVTLTVTTDGVSRDVPIDFFHAPKTLRLAALEVADFIMHAAGTAVRANLESGIPFLQRRDFAAVFGSVPDEYAEFMLLNELNAIAPPDRL